MAGWEWMSEDALSIMIVDDDILVRRALERTISRNLNARVEHFGHAHEALSRFSEAHFDVALLDVQMPDMSGIALAKALREVANKRGSCVRIIFVTADSDVLAGELKDAEPAAIVQKPWDREELLRLVNHGS